MNTAQKQNVIWCDVCCSHVDIPHNCAILWKKECRVAMAELARFQELFGPDVTAEMLQEGLEARERERGLRIEKVNHILTRLDAVAELTTEAS